MKPFEVILSDTMTTAPIRIEIPENRCSPGSTLAGTVFLCGKKDINVQYITITLQAKCMTEVSKTNGHSEWSNSAKYYGEVPLLHLKQELFTGPYTLHPGHSWPFVFTLPSQCNVQPDDHFKQQRGPFNSDPDQSLPPSFADSHPSIRRSAQSSIQYELEARLGGSRSKIWANGDVAYVSELDFTTFRSVQQPDPQPNLKKQTIACHSLHLQPGYEEATLTLKERLKSMRKSKLPVAAFKLYVQLPTIGVAGQPPQVFLKLEHDPESSTSPAPPIVLLKKCSLHLEACTLIECIRNSMLRGSDVQRSWRDDYVIASVDFSKNMVAAPALTDEFNLSDVMSTRKLSKIPSFNTFSIRRTYRLRLKVSVECAHKTFKADFWVFDFVLLAQDYKPPPRPLGSAPEASSSRVAHDEEEAPAYQKSVRPHLPGYQDAKMS